VEERVASPRRAGLDGPRGERLTTRDMLEPTTRAGLFLGSRSIRRLSGISRRGSRCTRFNQSERIRSGCQLSHPAALGRWRTSLRVREVCQRIARQSTPNDFWWSPGGCAQCWNRTRAGKPIASLLRLQRSELVFHRSMIRNRARGSSERSYGSPTLRFVWRSFRWSRTLGLLPRIGWRSAALDQPQLHEARRQVRRPAAVLSLLVAKAAHRRRAVRRG
jgi:hypothetical protein